MTLYPVSPDGEVRPAVSARCRDVSLGGVGCVGAYPAEVRHFYAAFEGVPAAAGWAVLARVIRTQPDADGQLLGAQFLTGG